MNKLSPFHFDVLLSLSLLLGVAPCRASDEIQTYTVPKDHPPISQPAMAGDIPGVQNTQSPPNWTPPPSWQVLPPNSVRIGNFLVTGTNGQKAEVAVTSFRGTVGAELDNVNRWRRELQLTPVSESDIVSSPVTVDSIDAKLYDFTSQTSRTIIASVPRNGSTWFFKIKGDAPTVAAAQPDFFDFLKSVHFSDIPASAPADPHAGLGIMPPGHENVAAPPADAAADSPKWNIPADWIEQQSGPMIFKTFSISSAPDQTATVTFSVFPGSVGGVLANVNRWRGQLGLAFVTDDTLANDVQPLDTSTGKATLVDLTGVNAKTGKPARLIAVIVPQNDNTWFYKLLGPPPLVATKIDSFTTVVKTASYP